MATLRILLIVIFLIAALAVTVVVLLQEGKSAGLGSMAGAGTNGDSYWDKNKKYSLEGKFERWTKIAAAVMLIAAFVLMFIPTATKSTTEGNNATTEIVQPTESEGTDASASEQTTDTSVENQEASSTETASPESSATTEGAETPAVSETPAQ